MSMMKKFNNLFVNEDDFGDEVVENPLPLFSSGIGNATVYRLPSLTSLKREPQ